MFFDIIIHDDMIVWNFNGINYVISSYIFEIMKIIHPDTFFNNISIEKKFKNYIRDMKEHILNFKYENPFLRCIEINNILIDNDLLPDEQLRFLNKLTFDVFKNKITECVKYEYEIFIIVGIEKNIIGKINNKIDNSNYIINENINYIINSLSLDPKRYLINNLSYPHLKNTDKLLKYKFAKSEINKNEKNNCLIVNYIMNTINVKYDNLFFDNNTCKKILKNKLIFEIVSEIINEPLFDQIRTIDKLGYIVKSDFIYKKINNDKIMMVVYYLIQSNFNIKKIKNSVESFNKFIKKDIKDNKKIYLEKFNSLIKSKLLLLEKTFVDLNDEITNYLQSFINKFGIFNINEYMVNVCKKIKFSDILDGLKIITNDKNLNTIEFNNKN
jgi:hypothetical protein